MLPRITICIGNRFTWGAIELTIESILAKTSYPNYEILVIDNSQSPRNPRFDPLRDLTNCDDDGSRLGYLREQAKKGNIRLIERVEKYDKYGHGRNIEIALDNCRTPYAMLLSSGNEIINPDWLIRFFWKMRDLDHDLGVAIQTEGLQHFDNCWIAPRYLPNWMMLNVELYRSLRSDDDWSLKRVPFPDYKYKHIFDGKEPPKHPAQDPVRVFLDTGWKLYEKLNFEDNPKGLKMVDFRPWEQHECFNYLGGMDRNAHRPNHEHVIKNRALIGAKLKILREQ